MSLIDVSIVSLFLLYYLRAFLQGAQYKSSSFVSRGSSFWKKVGDYFDAKCEIDAYEVDERGTKTERKMKKLNEREKFVFALYPHHAMSVGHALTVRISFFLSSSLD